MTDYPDPEHFTQLFIVSREAEDEDRPVKAAFTSRELAEAYIEESLKERYRSDCRITQVNLDPNWDHLNAEKGPNLLLERESGQEG